MVDELAGEHIARFFVNGGDMIAPEIRIFVPVVSYASRNLFQQSTFTYQKYFSFDAFILTFLCFIGLVRLS